MSESASDDEEPGDEESEEVDEADLMPVAARLKGSASTAPPSAPEAPESGEAASLAPPPEASPGPAPPPRSLFRKRSPPPMIGDLNRRDAPRAPLAPPMMARLLPNRRKAGVAGGAPEAAPPKLPPPSKLPLPEKEDVRPSNEEPRLSNEALRSAASPLRAVKMMGGATTDATAAGAPAAGSCFTLKAL